MTHIALYGPFKGLTQLLNIISKPYTALKRALCASLIALSSDQALSTGGAYIKMMVKRENEREREREREREMLQEEVFPCH